MSDALPLTSLFASFITEYALKDPALIGALEEAAWMLEAGDEAGGRWCDEHGYDGYTSYASLDDLPIRAPAFASLKERLDTLSAQYAEALDWDMTGRSLTLDGLWVNILGEGGSHSGHVHPNSVISGTVYIAMPEGSGALKFEDPRLAMMMAAPPTAPKAREDRRRFIYRTPKPGSVLMWESWLRHEVLPNRAEAPRISASFNYSLQTC